MIGKPFLASTAIALLMISGFFTLLSAFSIPFQFYLWEFYFDGKTLAVAGLIFTLWKRGRISFTADQFVFIRFDWRKNVWIFFAPVLFYALPIAAGYFFKEVSIVPLDNAATLILGTLFDIPAIFAFSVTSVLLEEVLFRGITFHSFRRHYTLRNALIFSNALWTAYCIPEIITIPDLTLLLGGVAGLFFFSLGLFCSVVSLRSTSLWVGYSFRIGLVSLTPILLTSIVAESDSFFTASSPVFIAEGILVSVAMLTASMFILQKEPVSAKNAEN
jgi:membrane protease YdiL (CAAX protease family)